MRCLLGAVLTAALLPACVPPPPEPQVVQTMDAAARAVLEARAMLEQPVEALAAATVGVIGRLDAVRHEVPRGAAQSSAAREVRQDLAGLRAGAGRLRERLSDLDEPALQRARPAVSGLVGATLDVADSVEADLDDLEGLVEFDESLDEVVASWHEAGSRSARVAALQAAVERAQQLARQAGELEVGACAGMRDNRVRWSAVVAERSEQLLEAARTRDGTRFDRLRARFGRAPYAEERAAADAEHRPCWADSSPLPGLEDQVRSGVEAVETALGG